MPLMANFFKRNGFLLAQIVAVYEIVCKFGAENAETLERE